MKFTAGFSSIHHAGLGLILLCLVVLTLSCRSPQSTTGTPAPDSEAASEYEDQQAEPAREWVVRSGEPQFLRPRTWNLHHQAARLSFDFEREAVEGSTEMLFTNMRESSRELILDSKTTELHSVRISGNNTDLSFQQDSAIVTINLGQDFSRNDTLSLTIDFTSFPPARGLYFVDPLDQDPSKPTQIWTLGQPEDNSFWLPTIDHPAERTTQEFWLTVPDSMQTLSNGFLISSRDHPESRQRTDYWRLDLPHTPYLFALAVGEYDITDRWVDDIYFAYYTEPQYTKYVDLIYDQTEDIMEYFNQHFGYRYPWGAYAQVPVHDFIASGMENTTATILINHVQFDERGSLDRSNLSLIVHELVHQWFGNLVTTKDWANLPFNEGFANYFEIQYMRDMVSYDKGVWHSLGHKHDYFSEAQLYRRPIIFNEYTEPEDMYDRHTYAKAGQVLGMLNELLGDEVWWAALSNLLHTFEYQAVDMRDVQHVFEQETGENLSWFFDQWFYEPGHPVLEISYEIQENQEQTAEQVEVQIKQVQDLDRQPVFTLFTEMDVVTRSGTTQHSIEIDSETASFQFEITEPVLDIIFDPKGLQLVELNQELNAAQLGMRLKHEEPAVRFYALSFIEGHELASGFADELIELVSTDPHQELRADAMRLLAGIESEEVLRLALQAEYDSQPLSRTRIEAMNAMQPFGEMDQVQTHLREALSDTSYFVSAAAKRHYATQGYEDAFELIYPYRDAYSWNHVTRNAVVDAMLTLGDEQAALVLIEMAAHPGEHAYKSKALQQLSQAELPEPLEQATLQLFLQTLNDPYISNRMFAIRGLGQSGHPDALQALRTYRDETDVSEERELLDEVLGMP